MTKRIIEISSEGCYLSYKHEQLVIRREDQEIGRVPIEDMAALIIDHPRTTLSQPVLSALVSAGVMVVTSGEAHQPIGMFLPLQGHVTQTERFIAQAELAKPTKKSLWAQIVKAKIAMQAKILGDLTEGDGGLGALRKKVRSGDPDNIEAQAARRYWPRLFPEGAFKRDVEAGDQNRFLNYGYAILRSLTARSLCGAGLHPSLGLHHRNRYNAYCLADDLIEPYRPFVDLLVYELVGVYGAEAELGKEHRAAILELLTWEVNMGKETYSFQGAVRKSAQSLANVIIGQAKQLVLPTT